MKKSVSLAIFLHLSILIRTFAQGLEAARNLFASSSGLVWSGIFQKKKVMGRMG